MIKFQCPHCDVKISAELSDAGVAANCPTCGKDLVVPVASFEGRADLQQTVVPSSAGNLPLVRGLHKKSAPGSGKKMVMVGVLALAVATMIGVITMAKPTDRKSDGEVKADIHKTAKVINLTSIGGRLDDFVGKYSEDSDRYEVYDKAQKGEKKGLKVLVVSHNSKIIIGYNEENIITSIVYYKHDENIRKSIPLNKDEVDEALQTFSRHKGAKWIRLDSGDMGGTRQYGYGVFDESVKFGREVLSATYDEDLPYLIIWAGSDREKAIDGLNGTTIRDLQNLEYRRAE